MPTINELVEPAELIGVVRQLTFPQFTLAGLFPERDVLSIDYSFIRGNVDTLRAAPVRAYDAESPIGTRPGLTRSVGQLPPISQKIPLTEGERLMLEGLFRGSGATGQVQEAIFADAARMVRSVKARVELARGDVLTDGILTLNENGIQATVDFGVPAAHKVTAAASWAVAATDILGDIRSWVATYIDTTGGPPARAIASTQVITYMLQNTKIRELAGSILGVPTFVSQGQLSQILAAFGLPPVEAYDLQVYDAAGTKVRVIPNDRFIMLPGEGEVLGETQYGPTVEAMELVGDGLLPAEAAPGPVAVVYKTKDPVQIWTKGVAIALPLLVNPDLLFTADVVP